MAVAAKAKLRFMTEQRASELAEEEAEAMPGGGLALASKMAPQATRNPKSETRNPRPGTRNQKPETRDPKPETPGSSS